MTKFKSLERSLYGKFSVPFSQLPKELQLRVNRSFHPRSWEKMDAEERRNYAKSWDFQNDHTIKELRDGIAAKTDRNSSDYSLDEVKRLRGDYLPKRTRKSVSRKILPPLEFGDVETFPLPYATRKEVSGPEKLEDGEVAQLAKDSVTTIVSNEGQRFLDDEQVDKDPPPQIPSELQVKLPSVAEYKPVVNDQKTLAPVAAEDVSDGETWINKARYIAAEIIKRQSKQDLFPNQIDIADEIARRFRTTGILGTSGKPLAGAYIKRYALKGISSAQGKQLSTTARRGK